MEDAVAVTMVSVPWYVIAILGIGAGIGYGLVLLSLAMWVIENVTHSKTSVIKLTHSETPRTEIRVITSARKWEFEAWEKHKQVVEMLNKENWYANRYDYWM